MRNDHSSAARFSALAHEHAPGLRRFLQRRVGDAAADDLLQETLLKIARGLDGFAGRAKLKTWLYAIARNVATDHLRRAANRQPTVDIEAASQVVDDAVSEEDALEFECMNRCVRQVIDSLPADYRSALVLHDLEGKNCQQVSEAMGGTVGAAKVRIHRARARLKVQLERRCGFYHDSDSVLRCEPRG